MDENKCHFLKRLLEMFHSKERKLYPTKCGSEGLRKFNKQEALLMIDQWNLCSIWATEFAFLMQGLVNAQFHTKCKNSKSVSFSDLTK